MSFHRPTSNINFFFKRPNIKRVSYQRMSKKFISFLLILVTSYGRWFVEGRINTMGLGEWY